MANNHLKRTYLVRPFLFFFLLIITTGVTNAQKLSKYYTSAMQENGVLYFIEPKQEFKNSKENARLTYDLTYLTTKDTVLLNFTYLDNTIRLIDSISIIHGDKHISSIAKKIFIETDKKFWKHRYSLGFLFTDIDLLFQQEKSPKFVIYYENKHTQLGIKSSKWTKQSAIISKILMLIKANKKSS
ncbi:MAG: hypothetical protein RBR87_03600 [Bacteroidales bacterium]|jgi:hypothetical protein|nr:hypothetical protein [Bacteroidales bacterium]